MFSGTATITATTGPGRTVSAAVYSNVKSFYVDIEKQMLFLYFSNDDVTGPVKQFALTSTVTFTVTVTSGNYAVTISAS